MEIIEYYVRIGRFTGCIFILRVNYNFPVAETIYSSGAVYNMTPVQHKQVKLKNGVWIPKDPTGTSL